MHKWYFFAAAAIAVPAMAQDNFSYQNSISRVVVQDNLWWNPALIAQTVQQVGVNTTGNGGAVFDAFGQKAAIHAGQVSTPQFSVITRDSTDAKPEAADAIDLFFGGDIAGQTGVRLSLVQNTTSGLATTEIVGPGGGVIFVTEEPQTFDVGNDTLSADFKQNKDIVAYSAYGISVGQWQPKSSYAISLNIPLFNNQSVLEYTATNNESGGDELTEDYLNNEQTKSGPSGEVSANGRYYLRQDVYVGGAASYNRYATESVVNIKTVNKLNGAEQANAIESETKKFYTKSQLAGEVSIGIQRESNTTVFRLEQTLGWERVTEKSEEYATEVSGENDPTGIENAARATAQTIRMPLHVSIEAKPGEKWSWRVGARADIFTFAFNKGLVDQISADDGSFELDYTSLDSRGYTRVTDGAEILLGVGWQPVEKLQINAVVNQMFFTDGLLDNGLATELSASYRF